MFTNRAMVNGYEFCLVSERLTSFELLEEAQCCGVLASLV
jgi:hypothetical protein